MRDAELLQMYFDRHNTVLVLLTLWVTMAAGVLAVAATRVQSNVAYIALIGFFLFAIFNLMALRGVQKVRRSIYELLDDATPPDNGGHQVLALYLR